MRFPLLSLLFLSFIFSGCAGMTSQINWNDPASIVPHIEVKRDNFKKLTKYDGPNCSKSMFDRVFIRAWKYDNIDEIQFQIYVIDQYGGKSWRFYDSAWDSNGNRLDTTVISRDVESCVSYGCSHYEHIGLNVNKEYLESNSFSNMEFKISGKGGEEIFSIPAAYIDAFLKVAK